MTSDALPYSHLPEPLLVCTSPISSPAVTNTCFSLFLLMNSIGNIVSLCSTCFLYGPWTQAKKMFAPSRLAASGIYLFFLGFTMFLAFYKSYIPARTLLLLMSICAQFMALSWYSISFIPYARDFVKQCCITTCCSCLKPQQQQTSQNNFFSLL